MEPHSACLYVIVSIGVEHNIILFLSLLFILVSIYKLARSQFSLSTSVNRISIFIIFKLLTRSYITFKAISVQERLTLISLLQFY